MKKILLILSMVLSVLLKAQDINEELFNAVSADDKQKTLALLTAKADPNFHPTSGKWANSSPLITAVLRKNLELVQILLQYKANVNWKDNKNFTALMYAATTGNKELVQLLVDSGADLKANDGKGTSVLSAAKTSGNPEVIYIVEKNLGD